MEVLNLIQGTPEWAAHRSTHWNASDAPAMMGCSPYKTRQDLIKEMATGLTPEVDAATQRRFDDGHRFEALARPLAEAIMDDELFPITGKSGKYSASFDGLTMDEQEAFEHKSLNDALRAVMYEGMDGAELPMQYRVQMEQQCMVSDCKQVLFMASKWQGETLVEKRHCWYYPDLELRAAIVAGWAQLEADVAAYVPVEVVEQARAEPTLGLPAVTIQFSGAVALTSNLDLFGAALRKFIGGMDKDPQDDQAFANLDAAVKTLKKAEEALNAAEVGALAQTASVDDMRKTVALLIGIARSERLAAEKLVTAKKEQIRLDAVKDGSSKFVDHIFGLNKRLGAALMPPVATDFPGVIKGKRTIDSLRGAVADELARAKIAANEIADRIAINLRTLEASSEHSGLFADRAALVLKAPDDLAAVVSSRIAAHLAAEAAKLEAQREKIRAEEQAKAQAEADEKIAAAARAAAEQARADSEAARRVEAARSAAATEAKLQEQARQFEEQERREIARRAALNSQMVHHVVIEPEAAAPTANVIPMTRPAAPTAGATPTLKLGQISERLGVGITAAFLRDLGFEIALKDRASCLYFEHDFGAMCAAMVRHIEGVQAKQAA